MSWRAQSADDFGDRALLRLGDRAAVGTVEDEQLDTAGTESLGLAHAPVFQQGRARCARVTKVALCFDGGQEADRARAASG